MQSLHIDTTARLFGLCPLLAVTDTLCKSMAIGSLLVVTLVCGSLLGVATRWWVSRRLAALLNLVIAVTLVTCMHYLVIASRPELATALGIYLPLLAANGLLVGHLLTASHQPSYRAALVSSLSDAAIVAGFCVVLGALREVLARGTVGSDFSLLLDRDAQPVSDSIGLAGAPAGALILAGLLIALTRIGKRRGTGSPGAA